jgi:hypothetical protein
VTGQERAVRWVTDHFEGVAPEYARDVALTTREVSGDVGPCGRFLQLASVAGLALRLRARSRTDSRPDAVWRQGLYVGGQALLCAATAQLWVELAGAPDRGSRWFVWARIVAAVALSASVGLSLSSRRRLAVVMVGVGMLAQGTLLEHGRPAAAFASYCVVAACGLLGGSPTAAARGRSRVFVIGLIALASCSLALAAGADVAGDTTRLVFFWLLPALLIVLGWFDPRLAAAATTLVFARLAASGFDELGRALAVLEDDSQRALLVRWIVMGTAVPATWLATRQSIRRLTRL